MKRNKILPKIKLFLVVLFLSATPLLLNAQTNFDETESDGGDVGDTPVNGGVVLLLIAGIGFGAFKIYKVKAENRLSKAI